MFYHVFTVGRDSVVLGLLLNLYFIHYKRNNPMTLKVKGAGDSESYYALLMLSRYQLCSFCACFCHPPAQ